MFSNQVSFDINILFSPGTCSTTDTQTPLRLCPNLKGLMFQSFHPYNQKFQYGIVCVVTCSLDDDDDLDDDHSNIKK